MTWSRGQSGNAHGRAGGNVVTESKRVALMIRELTNEGRDLVEAMLEIADIGPNARPDLRTNTPGEKRIRGEMLRFLFERLFGKTPQEINLMLDVGDAPSNFAPLSEDTLAELAGCAVLGALPGALESAQDDAPGDGAVDAELVEDDDSEDPDALGEDLDE